MQHNHTTTFSCECPDSCAVCDLGNHHHCRTGLCSLGTPAALRAFAKRAKELVHA